MNWKFFALVSCLLFFSAREPASQGWGDWVVDWFTHLIWGEDEEPNREAEHVSPNLLASLSDVPASDTLTTLHGWPVLSLDVVGDLERGNRLEKSLTLVRNEAGPLPLDPATPVRLVYREGERPVQLVEMVRRFADVQEVAFTSDLVTALPHAEPMPTLVVVSDAPGVGTGSEWYIPLRSIDSLTLIHFGDPTLIDPPSSWNWINAPLRSRESETRIAQAIFGAAGLTGTLADGRGIRLRAIRGGFRTPEALGIDRFRFERIDNAINRAIRYGATPGAQLAVLKNGQVVYERSYGFHRYAKEEVVRVSDLYDLASITKAAATSLAVMKLYDEGRIDLDARVSTYLPEYRNKVVGNYRIDQLLTHHTGLQPGLPIYPYFNDDFIKDEFDPLHRLPLSATRWLDDRTPELLRHTLDQVAYTRRPEHRYSDVNYVLLQLIVEQISGQPLDVYVTKHFYDPMGLHRLAFRPLERFPIKQLIPTIVDRWMNRGELHGYVHDEGAAMMGGVAGHAGLFGNALDLGRLFQLLNDRGNYAGKQLISEKTVALFTARGPYNYRALGFDRLAGGYGSVVAAGASENTVGHTGFTGTCVWADPDNDMVFVFLTNRIHPDPANEKLLKYHTRSAIHRDVYHALRSYRSEDPA
ncbi:CubicO group peptidase (beta-lactamase class C family) [Neolewinella xylanilytica]|uniref:CubicO group peptidase (Beta-lactamase class C family) n=1 Tax=Neolewinella xylanilytica TaxID=1514080 RepID=A0A2S6I5Q8_9BACT|nr:serine hydrolase [Neolewinella xylanilytica]PPK86506.1 CubicO group peptidase (beta-lactamase class C family) [Neolewinella xylanilytica]